MLDGAARVGRQEVPIQLREKGEDVTKKKLGADESCELREKNFPLHRQLVFKNPHPDEDPKNGNGYNKC